MVQERDIISQLGLFLKAAKIGTEGVRQGFLSPAAKIKSLFHLLIALQVVDDWVGFAGDRVSKKPIRSISSFSLY